MFSRSEKLILAALILCVAFTGAMIPVGANWLLLRADDNNPRYAEYYHRKCASQQSIGFFPDGRSFIKTASENAVANENQPPAKSNAEQADYCDLAAQYVAARSAETSSYWSAFTAFLTFIGVGLIAQTMLYTRNAADATRRAVDVGEIANRRMKRSNDIAAAARRDVDFRRFGHHEEYKDE